MLTGGLECQSRGRARPAASVLLIDERNNFVAPPVHVNARWGRIRVMIRGKGLEPLLSPPSNVKDILLIISIIIPYRRDVANKIHGRSETSDCTVVWCSASQIHLGHVRYDDIHL